MLRKTGKSTTVIACLMAQTGALKFRPPEGSVPWTEKATRPIWTNPEEYEDHPVNYFVPHFGTDTDMKSTTSNIEKAEEELKHVLTVTSNDVPKNSNVFADYE